MQRHNSGGVQKCPKCGSEHFWELEYRQYLAGTYSSLPGGELMASSPDVRVRVCLCEHMEIQSLRSLPPDEREAATSSLEKARRHREKGQPENFKKMLSKEFVGRMRFEALGKQCADLAKVIKGLSKEGEKR